MLCIFRVFQIYMLNHLASFLPNHLTSNWVHGVLSVQSSVSAVAKDPWVYIALVIKQAAMVGKDCMGEMLAAKGLLYCTGH